MKNIIFFVITTGLLINGCSSGVSRATPPDPKLDWSAVISDSLFDPIVNNSTGITIMVSNSNIQAFDKNGNSIWTVNLAQKGIVLNNVAPVYNQQTSLLVLSAQNQIVGINGNTGQVIYTTAITGNFINLDANNSKIIFNDYTATNGNTVELMQEATGVISWIKGLSQPVKNSTIVTNTAGSDTVIVMENNQIEFLNADTGTTSQAIISSSNELTGIYLKGNNNILILSYGQIILLSKNPSSSLFSVVTTLNVAMPNDIINNGDNFLLRYDNSVQIITANGSVINDTLPQTVTDALLTSTSDSNVDRLVTISDFGSIYYFDVNYNQMSVSGVTHGLLCPEANRFLLNKTANKLYAYSSNSLCSIDQNYNLTAWNPIDPGFFINDLQLELDNSQLIAKVYDTAGDALLYNISM